MSEKIYGFELLKKLCEAFGPSSCEDEISDIIKEQLDGFCDEIKEQFPGFLTVFIKGSGKGKLMISCHMDEVGFIVQRIDDEGYLYFKPLGGMNLATLPSKRVVIKNENGIYKGLIASRSIHLRTKEEREKSDKMDEMYIDIGANSKEDAEKYVAIGDFVTFDSDFVNFGDGMIKSKAIDDRGGCAVMCDVIRDIKKNNIVPYHDLYFVFSVREELGLSGATVAAQTIQPDYSLVIESTAFADIYGVAEHKQVGKIKEGAAISFMDNGTVYFKDMYGFAIKKAKEAGIKVQKKQYVSGGTDNAHIHKSCGGVKCINLSVPCRYIHSPSSVYSKEDYEAALKLTSLIVKERIE